MSTAPSERTRGRPASAGRAILIAAALALLSVVACGGSGAGDGEPVGERIVLVRDRQLLLRAPDGEERTKFVSEASNRFPAFPAWSPDGTRIAFVQSTFPLTADDDWGDDVYVLDAAGGEPQLARTHAAPGEQIMGLTWTADGAALIAGVNSPEGPPGGSITGFDPALHRIDLATGDSSVLVAGALEPSLSRDGTRLAYLVPGEPGNTTLWTAAADGSDARAVPLPANLDPPFAPRVSPDGASIAFAAPTTGAFSARPAPARGVLASLADALPFPPRRAEARARSGAHGVPMEVWRVDLDDGTLTPLTSFAEDDPRSAWEPDGSALFVLGTGGLYRVATDGSGVERIGDGAFAGQLDVR